MRRTNRVFKQFLEFNIDSWEQESFEEESIVTFSH
jgi:hypothetical protein